MGRKRRKILAAKELEIDPSDKDRARFFAKTRTGKIPDGFTTPCLEWRAGTDSDGYGRFWFRGVNMLAHRFAYAADVGPIAARHDVDHLCTNRRCVNTDHLEQKPPAENRPEGRWRGHWEGEVA
jgi:hypothetical protein